jgi:hypothetical protein
LNLLLSLRFLVVVGELTPGSSNTDVNQEFMFIFLVKLR